MSDQRRPRRRLTLLLAGVALWAAVVVVRLVDVMVYRAADLQELAARQQSSVLELDPVRGSILDRNGVELALTRDLRSVYAVPGLVGSPERAAEALARALRTDRRKLLARLRQTERNFVWVARKVSDEEAERVAELALPGIAFLEEPKRFYPKGPLAAQVLGYVGLDNEGLGGLEQQFDSEVRGIPGVKLTLRDARGVRFLPEPGGQPAEPGRNLVLTLDAALQHVVERELARALEEFDARRAVGLVLDPFTGEVLAMASAPGFDPNDYARAPAAARRNPAVQDAYEPGSTFKIVAFAGALERGRLGLGEVLDCGRGGITVAGTRIGDHERFDLLSPLEVIAHSSNVGAIVVGSRLAPDELYATVRRFGFGRPTGIELPGESPGLLRPTRDWSGLSRAMWSIGQEIGVTPLQLASAFAAVANGGVLLRPRVVRRVEEPDGRVVRENAPEAVRRVIEPGTARTLVAMMEEVVRSGTATAARMEGVRVAGKTGTAQKIVDGVYAPGRYVASFVGFAPVESPRLLALVALDEPRGWVYYGGLAAAPVVKRILLPALALAGVPADGRVVSAPLLDFYPDAAAAPAGEAEATRLARLEGGLRAPAAPPPE